MINVPDNSNGWNHSEFPPTHFGRTVVLHLKLFLRNTLVSTVKLVTVVEEDPKAPFSIATTPKCREERYSFPWIAPLYS